MVYFTAYPRTSMQHPPYHAPPPRPAKTNAGCLIALAVLGGVVVLVGAIVAYGVWRFSTSKTGSTILAVAGEGAKVMIDAQNMPGAADLRAMGCKSAGVVDIARFDAVMRKHLDAGIMPARTFSLVVGCTVADGARVFACDDVARAYVRAVGRASGRFAVSVREESASSCSCVTLYEPTGAKVGSMPSASVPRFP